MKEHRIKVRSTLSVRVYSALLFLCWMAVIFCTLLKLVGYKGFVIPQIEEHIPDAVKVIINGILYLINSFTFLFLLLKRRPTLKESLLLLIYVPLFVMSIFRPLLPLVTCLEVASYILLACFLIRDCKLYKRIIEAITILLVFSSYSFLTSITKELNIFGYKYNFLEGVILQIDYYILIFITVHWAVKKGGLFYGLVGQTILAIFSKRKSVKETIQQDIPQEPISYRVFLVAISLTQIIIVGLFCYFVNHVVLQFLFTFISFIVLRAVYGESYHAGSVLACTTLSIITFTLATRLTLPEFLSIMSCILIGLGIAFIMHILFFYKERSNSICIEKGMDRESLLEYCRNHSLTPDETKVIISYYCDKKKRWQIGNEMGYSEDNISKIKKKALDKLCKTLD